MWQVLFSFSHGLLVSSGEYLNWVSPYFLAISQFVSMLLAPAIGWLADVKFGRYEIIKFGSLATFLAGIFFYFALFTGGVSISSISLFSTSMVIVGFGATCFIAAILPFLTDQIIGATSDELSTVVHWYFWADNLGMGLCVTVFSFGLYPYIQIMGVAVAVIFGVCVGAIIISDCLCQQWLDKTHKVTNPIKLIVQVLNYTRKHRYPERRSAFTYIDEEQPTRMDYGKEKFGGPFIEEEVEDVKTVLRLLPLVACMSIGVGTSAMTPSTLLISDHMANTVLNVGVKSWLIPLLLIPIHQFLIRPLLGKYTPSMLKSIGIGLFVHLVGYILLETAGIWGVIVSKDQTRYLSCGTLSPLNTIVWPDYYWEWYWKLVPVIFCGVGRTIINVVLLKFIIAQSPEKMKGLVIGLMITVSGTFRSTVIVMISYRFTLCFDVITITGLALLMLVFILLSKRYKLRERNREINIHAIAEEHYERYMDQEEEYLRENPQYDISSESSIEDTSNSDQAD